MTKFISTAALTGLALTMAFSASATSMEVDGFKGFVSRISCPVVTETTNELPSAPALPAVNVLGVKKTPAIFTQICGGDMDAFNAYRAEMTTTGEVETAIITKNLNGDFVSKQEFEYSEKEGWPLMCSNYLPGETPDTWEYVGHMKYEYDEQGRVVAAENVDLDYVYRSVRYEYVYDTDSPLYNIQICYAMNDDMEWENYQMATYAFNEFGYTTEECFYSWSNEIDEWVPAYKKEADYNEVGWQTYYVYWYWDAENNDWTGVNAWGDSESYSWEYFANGEVKTEIRYAFENGAWINYYKKINEYDNAGFRVRYDWLYWNRQDQDWTGLDKWGRWESIAYNQYQLFEYDEFGRLTVHNVYTQRDSGEYQNNYRTLYDYAELENGGDCTETISGYISGGEFMPSSKTHIERNRFGSPVYDARYSYNNGEWEPKSEDFRYMDEYNFYIGSESYNYYGGVRRNDTKELNTYPEDFNPELGLFTPAYVEHWVGIGSTDEDWKKKDQYDYNWGPRGVLVGYVYYDYLMSNGCRQNGCDMEYDFSANTAEILYWPDANKTTDFYQNKTLSAIEYVNDQFYNGVDEWNNNISIKRTYVYEPRTQTGVEEKASISAGATEIARYDVTGARIDGQKTGINIVRYSDGTTRKVIVK